MKEKIHPEYHDITVTCACGAAYQLGSTKTSLRVDICAACHPLFTGKQKLMDTEGRVEKFRKRYSQATGPKLSKTKAKAAKAS
jgi:large subunit ribosomal protein L31